MTLATMPQTQARTPRSHGARVPRPRAAATRPAVGDCHDWPAVQGLLGRYTDPVGCPREVVTWPGHAGTVLVIDRDAATHEDRRLLAHLAADEPPENARLVCHHYLRDPRTPRCRALTREDLSALPFTSAVPAAAGRDRHEPAHGPGRSAGAPELRDRAGALHRLEAIEVGMSIPELRWRRHPPHCAGDVPPQTESVRDAIACFESYEPIRALTALALARHRADPVLSVAVLRAELKRIEASRIVLNHELRRAVLRAIRTQGLTLSEIAVRCGRLKRDAKGHTSGETSWLARRVGIAPESGGGVPTPWIHSDVLALIARRGLGICPREVEL
jgi:hypothetical protein